MFGEFMEPFMDNGYMEDGFDIGLNPMMNNGYMSDKYKPLKATTSNVQIAIAARLGCDPYDIKFVKLDELPYNLNTWRHSCFLSGVTNMNVDQFVFEDGSLITYAFCPFFPQCNTVHYLVDRAGTSQGF